MSVPLTSINFIEVVMKGSASAEGSNPVNIINVFHFFRGNPSIAISKAHIESAFNGTYATSVLSVLNSSYTQGFTSIRYPQDVTDAAVEFVESGVGVITGDRFPTSLSAYILQRSTLRGRSFRGSKHFGPMSESDSTTGTGDVFNAAALIRLNNLASVMILPFLDSDGNSWNPMVVSKKLSNFLVVPAIISAAFVVSALVNKRIGTMRRRKVKSVY